MTPITSDAIRTIIRNAGRVAPEQIAADLGWPLSRVERIAREQRLDLRIDAPHPTPIEQLSAIGNASKRNPTARYANITANFSPADYEILVARAKEHTLRRGALLTALFKGALKSGTLDSLLAIGRKEVGL